MLNALASSPSPRARAIQRAGDARELHRSLAREYADVIPPGQVLAAVTRIARRLQRSGYPHHLVADATEQTVRRQIAERVLNT